MRRMAPVSGKSPVWDARGGTTEYVGCWNVLHYIELVFDGANMEHRTFYIEHRTELVFYKIGRGVGSTPVLTSPHIAH